LQIGYSHDLYNNLTIILYEYFLLFFQFIFIMGTRGIYFFIINNS